MWFDTSNNRHIPTNSRLVQLRSESQPALFLDRDGVVNEDVHFLTDPAQIRILPGVIQAIHAVQCRFAIIIVTNQSGIARGYLTESQLLALHSTLLQQLDGCIVDALYYCPHLPDAPVAAYNQVCDCRKPKPGMLLRAAQEWNFDLSRSIMVGDTLRDAQAGQAAGVTSLLVGKQVTPSGFPCVPDLAAAVALIMAKAQNQRSQIDEPN